MRQVFDMYTYQCAEVRINRRSLIVRHVEKEIALSAAVSAERSTDHDQMRLALLSEVQIRLSNESRSVKVAASDMFFDFLLKAGATSLADSARHFGKAFANDLKFEIDDYFEPETKVVTRSGRFTVDELTRTWAFLVTIATLGQLWNERQANVDAVEVTVSTSKNKSRPKAVVRDVPVPELGKNWLARILSIELGFPRTKARSLIEQFTSRPELGRIDLFYKPLLVLSDNTVIVPTPYIRGSRFERNLFTLVATETYLDQKKKGYLPVLALEQEFKDAGFKALSNFHVQVKHRELTDIDLVAYKDGILFLGQCKIVIEPDTAYDVWKAESKIDFAAQQLDVCISHLDKVRTTLFERLALKREIESRVEPFIVTNTRQFTERQFRGYPVVDSRYLRFVLGGARGSIIQTGAGGIGIKPGRSYIEGERPSGDELAKLLRATIHNVRGREVAQKYEIRRVGNLKVHVPFASIRTAGDSKMIVTD